MIEYVVFVEGINQILVGINSNPMAVLVLFNRNWVATQWQ
jgi:hypothetical protein